MATEAYAQRFSGPIGQYLLGVQHRTTRRMFQPFSDATVLSLGGSHAQNAPILADLGHHTTVLGSDERCAHLLRDLVAAGRCEFATGDYYHLPYEDRSFDVVITYRMLAHVQRVDKYLDEATRVADRGVVLEYPSSRSVNMLAPLLFGTKLKIEGNTRTFQTFSPAEIDQHMARRGFVRTDRFAQFFWPMALHRAAHRVGLSRVLEAPARWLRLTALFGSPIIARYERADRNGSDAW